MTSKKKTAANRRNAKHSTGPKTAEGKARSSMNNLRHGMRARTLIMPDENPQDFDELKAPMQELYTPQTPAEQDLVDTLAINQWKLIRAQRLEAECLTEESTAIETRIAGFDRLTQIQTRLERAWFKAYKELERIRATRTQQQTAESTSKESKPKGKTDPKAEQPPQRLRVAWKDGDRTDVLFDGYTAGTKPPAPDPESPPNGTQNPTPST